MPYRLAIAQRTPYGRVDTGIRTLGLQSHNLARSPTALYPPYLSSLEKRNVLGGIRTPDPRLRRPLLYPTELQTRTHQICLMEAGDGNRTHVSSLEGWCSTIELHPHRNYLVVKRDKIHFANFTRHRDTR